MGRTIRLSLPRRFVGDLVHFAHKVPTIPVQRLFNVAELDRLRLLARFVVEADGDATRSILAAS